MRPNVLHPHGWNSCIAVKSNISIIIVVVVVVYRFSRLLLLFHHEIFFGVLLHNVTVWVRSRIMKFVIDTTATAVTD